MLKRLRRENSLQRKQSSADLEKLQQELASKEAAMTAALLERDTHIHNLNLTIMEIQSSTSWKVTSPLRKIVSALRRVGRSHPIIAPLPLPNTPQVRSDLDTTGIAHPEHIDTYAQWVEEFDTIDDIDRLCMYEEIGRWKVQPLLSIIMPVYNPPIDMLREAIESIRSQVYFNWELCIADDASTDHRVRLFLEQSAKSDHRIKVTYRTENGHISKASNSALDMAGPYC